MDKRDIRKALEHMGDKEEILKGLQKFRENIHFFRCNHSFLVEKYPNRWIAIQDEEVVATSKSLDGLMRILDRKKIDRGTCYVQFLDPHPKPQILTSIQARVSLAFSYLSK